MKWKEDEPLTWKEDEPLTWKGDEPLIWEGDKSLREQEWMKWKEDEPLIWKGDKSLREQEWMKWKEEKTDQRISFEKNNIEGFKEMFEKYTLNGEKMLVGRYTETEIEEMTQDDRRKLIYNGCMRTDEAIYQAEKKGKIAKSDLIKLLVEGEYEPKHLIKIGDETIYLSDVGEKWGSRRNHLAGYTSDGEIRFFYKSLSEGIRRSTDWYRIDWTYSKWERIENYSYETTTQVDHKIGEFFDNLPKKPISSSHFYSVGAKYNIPYLLKPSIQAKVQVKKIGNFEYDSAYDYCMGKSVNAVQEFYRNLKTDIILSWISETYSFQHTYLWEIHVDIVKAKLKDGTDIELHFWHAVNDNPNSVFIIRWDYAEWDVNSFGIRSNQLNLWPLCAKPIDYTSQAPIDRMSNNFKRYGRKYVDIRPLYQEMPLIKSYKEMIKKAENKSDTKSKNNPW